MAAEAFAWGTEDDAATRAIWLAGAAQQLPAAREGFSPTPAPVFKQAEAGSAPPASHPPEGSALGMVRNVPCKRPQTMN